MGGIPCRLFFASGRPNHGRCPRPVPTVFPLPFTSYLDESEGVVKRGTLAPGDLTSRGPCPSFDDHLTFIEVTREREWENRRTRSWTPAMVRSTRGKKKGGRECRPSSRGRMSRRCWRPSRTTLFNQPAVPWASFTNCQKKNGGVPYAPPRSTHRPFTEEATEC